MGSDSIQLRDQVAVLRRRWLLLVATVFVAVAGGLALSLSQSPTYVAQADVLVTPATVTSTGSEPVSAEQIATEAQAIASFSVAEQVIEALGLDENPDELLETVTVQPDQDGAAVLSISAARSDPTEAARVADGFAEEYLTSREERNTEQLASLDLLIDDITKRISESTDRIIVAVEPQKGELLAQRRGLQAQRAVLTERRAQLAISSGNSPIGEVVAPAVAPSSPASPQPIRDGALAGVLGLLLGIGLVFLREYFDDKVRDDGVLRAALANRPVLGRIPHLRRTHGGRLAMLTDPQSPAGEAYRALGVNVRFLLAAAAQEPVSTLGRERQTGRVLLIGSASPGEGKTFTAGNLAVVAAAAGLRVAVVDADLRRPRIGQLFGLGEVAGLADLLAGDYALGDVLLDVGVDDLWVLPAGTLPPNPAQLIQSAGMRAVVTELAAKADLVIVDSPALLAVADALELVPLADLTVLVARAKVSRRRALHAALQRIEQVGGVVPGGVLNDVNLKTQEYTDSYRD